MATKVEVYKTVDDKTFETLEQAEEHERQLAVLKKLEKFVDNYCWNGMSAREVAAELFEHADKLIEALQ